MSFSKFNYYLHGPGPINKILSHFPIEKTKKKERKEGIEVKLKGKNNFRSEFRYKLFRCEGRHEWGNI